MFLPFKRRVLFGVSSEADVIAVDVVRSCAVSVVAAEAWICILVNSTSFCIGLERCMRDSRC